MSPTRRDFLRGCGAGLLSLGGATLCTARLLHAETDPGRGRYALLVDLARCRREQGCSACRQACHLGHNVPEVPLGRQEVKWIWKEDFERVFPAECHPYLPREDRGLGVPVLCNHCDDPPCVRVCPTGATFRRPDGIVGMDPHRCIGCRYCMAACPYGARSFNFRDPEPFIARRELSYPTRTRGVVEKCTFCVERLEAGRAPLCVEACPAGALSFGDTSLRGVAERLSSQHLLRRRPDLGTSPHVFYQL